MQDEVFSHPLFLRGGAREKRGSPGGPQRSGDEGRRSWVACLLVATLDSGNKPLLCLSQPTPHLVLLFRQWWRRLTTSGGGGGVLGCRVEEEAPLLLLGIKDPSVPRGGGTSMVLSSRLTPKSSSSHQLETQHHPERRASLEAGRTISKKRGHRGTAEVSPPRGESGSSPLAWCTL